VLRTLRYLTAEDDQLLGELATRVVYSAGDVLLPDGQDVDVLFVVRRGTVRLDTRADDRPHTLAWLSAPEVLGEGAFLGASATPFAVVADTEVHADMIGGRVLNETLSTRAAFAARLHRSIAFALQQRFLRLAFAASPWPAPRTW
jgi:CRP-like cAMP-binding protein